MRRDRAVLREAQFGTPREAQFHSGTAGQIRVDIVMPDKTAKREYFYEHDKAAEISGVSIGYLPGLIEIRTSRVAASGYARVPMQCSTSRRLSLMLAWAWRVIRRSTGE
jgi:hypothetical protein